MLLCQVWQWRVWRSIIPNVSPKFPESRDSNNLRRLTRFALRPYSGSSVRKMNINRCLQKVMNKSNGLQVKQTLGISPWHKSSWHVWIISSLWEPRCYLESSSCSALPPPPPPCTSRCSQHWEFGIGEIHIDPFLTACPNDLCLEPLRVFSPSSINTPQWMACKLLPFAYTHLSWAGRLMCSRIACCSGRRLARAHGL